MVAPNMYLVISHMDSGENRAFISVVQNCFNYPYVPKIAILRNLSHCDSQLTRLPIPMAWGGQHILMLWPNPYRSGTEVYYCTFATSLGQQGTCVIQPIIRIVLTFTLTDLCYLVLVNHYSYFVPIFAFWKLSHPKISWCPRHLWFSRTHKATTLTHNPNSQGHNCGRI